MRLKHAHDPLHAGRARGLEHRPDLRRVMAVVVDDDDAARLALAFEPALGAAELRQRGRRALERHVQLQRNADGCQRVGDVVPPGHAERQRSQHRFDAGRAADDRRARAVAFQLHVARAERGRRLVQPVRHDARSSPSRDGAQVRIVDAEHRRAGRGDRLGESLESLHEAVEVAIALQVLLVDVRHHCHLRSQQQERPVAFVRLRHQQRPRAHARVAAEGRESSANHHRRIEPRPIQHQPHHRRRGGLAVRAADRDALSRRHQIRQELPAEQHRNPAPLRLGNLRVRRAHRRRAHDRVNPAHVARRVSLVEHEPQRLEVRRHRRRLHVRAAHLHALPQQDLGERAHAASADADEVHRAQGVGHCSRHL